MMVSIYSYIVFLTRLPIIVIVGYRASLKLQSLPIRQHKVQCASSQ